MGDEFDMFFMRLNWSQTLDWYNPHTLIGNLRNQGRNGNLNSILPSDYTVFYVVGVF